MRSIKYKYILPIVCSVLFGTTSCVGDLDTIPLDEKELVSDVVFGSNVLAYEQAIAKLYAGMVIGGNTGGDSDQDVAGIDGGSQASFLRCIWNMQELPTDEAHCCWTDPGIPDFNEISWGASNPWIKGNYFRLFYQINVANAFLRETTEDKLNSRGCSEETKNTIKSFRAEARFVRALCYTYALDFYRNVPFVTEESTIGSDLPQQIMAADLFNYIEKELLECEGDMLDPSVGFNSNYGHANKAANWALQSRLFLNAEAFVGQSKYTECITACKKVINIGYSLDPIYRDVFKADNHLSPEMIFPLRYEGDQTMTWGGMTFLLCGITPSALRADVNAKDAWQGVRSKSSALDFFQKQSNYIEDSRMEMLHTDLTGNIEIVDKTSYVDNGIPVTKFFNVNRDGSLPPSVEAWTDYPMFRLAEVYLNYAEAVIRGGTGGDKATATNYINALRKRAYNDEAKAPITENSLTLDFILDEKGREFFFEAHRRTDLIRHNKFTSNAYLWPWKGGVANGVAVSDHFKVFPLPSDDIGSNTNLKQNEGYN